MVAIVVGSIESLGLVGGRLGFSGSFWRGVDAMNNNFNNLGFVIIGLFIASWAVSALIYRYKRLDDVEVQVSP